MPGHLCHCLVPLTTSTVRNLGTLVATALPGIPANQSVFGLYLQPEASNAAVVYVGGSATMSSSNYGVRLEVPASSVPQAPFLVPGGDRSGPTINLDDVYLLGNTNDEVSVFFQLSV